jgi:2-iminobutanoate/2-iminopropanoate deaminase
MSELRTISTDDAPAAIGPYSQAIVTDGWVFCSGQIPIDPATGEVLRGSAAEQTELIFSNIKAVLAEAGSSLSRVVKATVFISDMDLFATVNEVYARHFGEHRPARSTVAVRTLPKSVDVEIEVVARQ